MPYWELTMAKLGERTCLILASRAEETRELGKQNYHTKACDYKEPHATT